MFDVIWKGIVSGFFATLGFGVLFNVRGKNLILAGITGAIGSLAYKLALYYGYSDVFSTFIGGLALSCCSEIFARLFKSPVTIYLVCALIPLVPGGGMYRTMLEVVSDNIYTAMDIGVETLCTAGVLAIAILIVSTIARIFYSRKQKFLKSLELNK